jgi:hypothetical protein
MKRENQVHVIEAKNSIGPEAKPCGEFSQSPFLMDNNNGKRENRHRGLRPKEHRQAAVLYECIHDGIYFPGRPFNHVKSGQYGINAREHQNSDRNGPGADVVNIDVRPQVGLSSTFAFSSPEPACKCCEQSCWDSAVNGAASFMEGFPCPRIPVRVFSHSNRLLSAKQVSGFRNCLCQNAYSPHQSRQKTFITDLRMVNLLLPHRESGRCKAQGPFETRAPPRAAEDILQ